MVWVLLSMIELGPLILNLGHHAHLHAGIGNGISEQGQLLFLEKVLQMENR